MNQGEKIRSLSNILNDNETILHIKKSVSYIGNMKSLITPFSKNKKFQRLNRFYNLFELKF